MRPTPGGTHARPFQVPGYERHPPRYEYYLTDKGKALVPVLKALYAWGERYA